MGKSSSVAELVGKIDKYSNAIPKANRATVTNAAQAGKAVMLAGAAKSGLTPGSSLPRKNRSGKPGPKWGVRYTIKGDREPSAVLKYVGPVHWIDQGTKPHLIVPRNARARMGRISKKSGPNASQAAMAAALFGFMGGGGGAGLGGSDLTSGKGGVLSYGSNQFSRYVMHPGTAARPFWQDTKKKVIETTKRTAESTHSRALMQAFR